MALKSGPTYQLTLNAGLRERDGDGISEAVIFGVQGVLDQLTNELCDGGVAEMGARRVVDVVNSAISRGKSPSRPSQ